MGNILNPKEHCLWYSKHIITKIAAVSELNIGGLLDRNTEASQQYNLN